MAKKSVAIISNPASSNTVDLISALEGVDFVVSNYRLQELVIDTNSFSSSPFLSHDVYIFRGFHNSYTEARSLAQFLLSNGKVVIDTVLYQGYIPSKLHEALVYSTNDLPHPRTWHARSEEAWTKATIDVTYQIVVKRIDGEKGRDVYKCASAASVMQVVDDEPQNYIAQEYIENDGDIRVIIVGDAVLGAMKRTMPADDFRSNISIGGKATAHAITDAEAALALSAHKALGYDISGVDLIYHGESLYILETNIAPEWQGFQEATGIDVGSAIANLVKERVTND